MAIVKRLVCLTLIFGVASSCYSQSADTNAVKLPYGWTSGDVKANGITLHYYRTGNGSLPPMVLSHGYTDNGLCWTDLAHAMEKKYDVIMYDLRGHGLSDAPAKGYSIEDNVSDIVGLIKALKLQHPVIIGHSLGGSIAAIVAAQYPDIPKKVVLIDPPGLVKPMFETSEDMNRARSWFTRDMNNLKHLSKEDLIKVAAQRHPAISEAARGRWADSKMQMKPQIIDSVLTIPPLKPYLPKITVPTLILKADANDTVRKMEIDAVSAQPNIRVYHVKGAGHLVHLERPEESLVVLNDFLDDSKQQQNQAEKKKN
ncbi:MAG: alpha/beta hydrolase [Sedimentisphaerales bacterium]|jgi:pimeloyl-ACP methyl ester carboxylesterase